MKVTGIIAEYNPFHNGHKYQIQKARELTGADYIIVVMSGNFMQRGNPAIIDKYSRAKMAIKGGADLVIELPVCYATGSAEYFAAGAISVLNQLGCVDAICFGSETGEIEILERIASALVHESNEFKQVLKARLKIGETYPVARNAALAQTVEGMTTYDSILSSPNNILGIEYIKAIIRQNSSIKPYTNLRLGADYHSYKLGLNFSSAISIRQSLLNMNDLNMIRSQVPSESFGILEENYLKTFPVYETDFSSLVRFKILRELQSGFTDYMDVTQAISDKVSNGIWGMQEFDTFCDTLKSKDVTFARISRCLSHILLDIKKDDVDLYMDNGITFYARVLGLNTNAESLTKKIKSHTSIPLITKATTASKQLYPIGQKQFEQDIYAAHVYECIAGNKYHDGLKDEYRRQIEKV